MKKIQRQQEVHKIRIELRRTAGLVGSTSFSIVLSKQYAIQLGVGRGDFVKVSREQNRIVIEKA